VVLVLVTYALFLILEDAVKLVWGVESYFIAEPYGLLGNVELGSLSYPVYSGLQVLVAAATGLGLRWGIYGTRYGKLLLAVIHDREMSAAVGIDVRRVYLVTFTLGTTLAAIGGRDHRTDRLGGARHGRGGDRPRLRGDRDRGLGSVPGARRSAR